MKSDDSYTFQDAENDKKIDRIKELPSSAILRRGYLVPVLYMDRLHKTETVSDKEIKRFDFYTFRAAGNDKSYFPSRLTT